MRIVFENVLPKTFGQIVCSGGEINSLLDVVVCKKFEFKVDGIILAMTNNLVTAIQVLFTSHYIFNLAYPKGLSAFYTYIQKDIIKLQDSAPNMHKVIAFISKLNKGMI